MNQIKKYAKAVALDDRFKNSSVEWDFLAVSNSFTRDAELEAKQTGKPRGLVLELDEPKIRVWAKTWGQIIDESQGRLTFFKRGLEYEARAFQFFSESKRGFPFVFDCDSDSILVREASMDDESLFE